MNGVHYVERARNGICQKIYNSVDRLGADVGSITFRCVTWETTEFALSGTTVSQQG